MSLSTSFPFSLVHSLMGVVLDINVAIFQHVCLLSLIAFSILAVIPSVWFCEVLVRAKIFEKHEAHRQQCQQEPGFRQRTILITGVNSTKGLLLARSFYLSGHRVIGADFELHWLLSPARFSRALEKFHPFPLYLRVGTPDISTHEYAEDILTFVDAHSIDLWICCSAGNRVLMMDARAKDLVEERSPCRCVQFDKTATARAQGKPSCVFSLVEDELGVPFLETHRVISQTSIKCIQHDRAYSGKDLNQKYVLRPEITSHLFGPKIVGPELGPFFLFEIPQHLDQLDISYERPWSLERHISDGPYYRSHSLIVRGQSAVFIVCPISPENISRRGIRFSQKPAFYHCALDRANPLVSLMREYTESFIKLTSSSHTPITGHLSFEFALDTSKDRGLKESLYVLSCSTRLSTAMAISASSSSPLQFDNTHGMRAMVGAYLSVLDAENDTEKPPERSPPLSIKTQTTPNSPITGPSQFHSDSDTSDTPTSTSSDWVEILPEQLSLPPSALPTPPSTPPTSSLVPPETTTPLPPAPNPPRAEIIAPSNQPPGEHRYLLSHQLIARILVPLVKLITRQVTGDELYENARRLFNDMQVWKEVGFELWDPLPSFWLFAYGILRAWWGCEV